jgi:hypothetical protein
VGGRGFELGTDRRTTSRGIRHPTVRYATSAVSCGPDWPATSSGTAACVICPQAGHWRRWQRYSVMWAAIWGSSVT